MQLAYEVRDGKAAWGGRLLHDWVPDLVDALVRQFDPVAVILFGSVADRTDGPDSDVDLLIVLDEAPLAARRQLMVALRRATRMVGVPRDLLVTDIRDYERHRDVPGTLEYEPAQHGILLHERRTTTA